MSSARELLAEAPIPLREAELLLLHCLDRDRSWLFSHRDDALTGRPVEQYRKLVAARIAGEPIAYLLGEWEFWSLPLKVAPAVLIPRPDTEVLVEWALELLTATEADSVLDMGTGSGAIALAIAKERPDCAVTAIDISESALDVARRNGERLELPVTWCCSNWFSALDQQQWPVIVSNPPYIRKDDSHLDQGDLPAEPSLALVGGEDGLSCLRQLAEQAGAYLQPGGWLLLEHGWDQGASVRQLLQKAGFLRVSTRQDLAGHDRVTAGQWPHDE